MKTPHPSIIPGLAKKPQATITDFKGLLSYLMDKQIPPSEIIECYERYKGMTLENSIEKSLPPEIIIIRVANYYGITSTRLLGKCRKREIAEPRQQAIYFIKQKNKSMSLQKVADIFGINHATVIHSIKVVEMLKENNKEYKERFEKLTEIVNTL
jgi:chromosomal replication initiation ATPase DnaA